MIYAVDHIFFSGCLDSSGHEKVKSYRYKYDTLSAAKSRVKSCLDGLMTTSTVRLLRFSSSKGAYEVIGAFSPNLPYDVALDAIVEPSSIKAESIQSDLNRFL